MTAEVLLSEEAAQDRRRLNPTQERKLLWHAQRLRSDPGCGQQLAAPRIPERLRKDYGVTNLWRLPLPGGWRMLYPIVGGRERDPRVVVLRIVSHREYDRLLGYSTS